MRNIVIFICFSIYTFLCYGQNSITNQIQLKDNELLPPEVQKIIEYGDFTLNHTKGMANISIPIYTINTKTGFSVPISLDYVSKGVKVDEMASNVGLGWLLNAYGVITVENDLSYDNGVVLKKKLINNEGNEIINTDSELTDLYLYLDNIKMGNISGKVPIYNYSFFGRNGKFIIDNKGGVQGIPRTDLNISLNSDKSIISILDLEGNTYHFKKYQTALNYIPSLLEGPKTSVYYVLQDITLNNNEKIEFFYDTLDSGQGFIKRHQVSYYYNQEFSDLKEGYLNNINTNGYHLSCHRNAWPDDIDTKIYGSSLNLRIKQIQYDGLKILFRGSEEQGLAVENKPYRKDLGSKSSAIRKIEVHYKNQIIEYHDLQYTYFVSTDTNEEKPEKYRLKLQSVTKNNTLKHTFDYFEDIELPSRDSFAQDIWGYYNGKNSNQSLLSSVSFEKEDKNFSISGSDRSSGSLGQARAFTLKRITFPTQGYTEFMYDQIKEKKRVVKERKVSLGNSITLRVNDPEIFKNETFSLSAIGYNSSTDKLYLKSVNSCDNGQLADQTGNDQIVPGGTNGNVGINLPDGFKAAPYYETVLTGLQTTRNLKYGPIRPLGDEIKININRMGACLVTGGFIIERLVKDTITEYKTLGPIYLSGYKSFDFNGEIEKEVYYQYKKDLSTDNEIVDVDYVAPILNGISEYINQDIDPNPQGPSATNVLRTKKCYAIVRSSSPINNVKEYYFPYIHEITEGKGRIYYEFTGGVNPILIEKKEPYYDFNFDSSLEVNHDWKKGILIKKSFYNADNKQIYSVKYVYEYDNAFIQDSEDFCCVNGVSYNVILKGKFLTLLNSIELVPNNYFLYALTPISSSWIKKKEEIITNYTNQESMIQTVNYTYDNDNVLLSTNKTTVFNNTTIVEKYFYPPENTPLFTKRKGSLVKTELFKNGEKIRVVENLFKDWGNNLIEIENVKEYKGSQLADNQIKILHRDNNNGNIIEIENSGQKTVYLYGYNGSLEIGEIVNGSKEEVASALGVTVANLSAIDETKLTQINNLRTHATLKNAMITTYEHKPLVGVTKITDAKGLNTYYEYDDANRLQYIKDDKGNVLQQYEYNYKNN